MWQVFQQWLLCTVWWSAASCSLPCTAGCCAEPLSSAPGRSGTLQSWWLIDKIVHSPRQSPVPAVSGWSWCDVAKGSWGDEAFFLSANILAGRRGIVLGAPIPLLSGNRRAFGNVSSLMFLTKHPLNIPKAHHKLAWGKSFLLTGCDFVTQSCV